jgi:hypothetical protein
MYRILILETGEYLYRKDMPGWLSLYTAYEQSRIDTHTFTVFEASTKEEAKEVLERDCFKLYKDGPLYRPCETHEWYEIVEV